MANQQLHSKALKRYNSTHPKLMPLDLRIKIATKQVKKRKPSSSSNNVRIRVKEYIFKTEIR